MSKELIELFQRIGTSHGIALPRVWWRSHGETRLLQRNRVAFRSDRHVRTRFCAAMKIFR